MKKPIAVSVILSTLMCVAALAQNAPSDTSMKALKDNFKARYPRLVELKSAGIIGETWQGYVEAVASETLKNEKIKKLIVAENTDRKTLYQMIADSQETTPELVGERNGLRIFNNAASDEYLKHKDGVWRRKQAETD